MKNSLYLFLLAILLNSCHVSAEKKNPEIPDTVAVEKTGKHIQVPGTHIFIVPPKGTGFTNSNFVLRLTPNAEMRFEEMMTTSFHASEHTHMGEYIQQFNNNPFQSDIQYHKKFKLGKDSASLLYGRGGSKQKREILMVVGDDFHSALVYCTWPENQPALQQEILATIKSIYIDPITLVDYEASAPFSVDLSSSPFTLNYRKNDLVDYACLSKDSVTVNKIIVKPGLPFNKKVELNYAIDSHKKIMTSIQVQVEKAPNKEVVINGYQGIESTFLAHFPQNNVLRGRKMVYLLYLSNKNSSLLYSCYIDVAEKDIFEFARKGAKTIRLK